MKIQGILDLSGFELQNFCIQNYTDKANVANIGRGRKFFFTGNSTDQDYNREVIWDGGKWRAAAYLDDIDKINEKLDLIFGDELDTDTIIDSWKEVQDFLSGIEDTKNLMTMLDGKAEWNQDISSDSFKAIGYGYVGTGWRFNGSALSFGANSTYYAQLQISAIDDHIVFRRHATEGFSDWKEILHEGNFESLIGDTYLKTDGSNRLEKGANLKWVGISENGEDYNSFGYGFRLLSYDTASDNYRGGIHVGTYYGFQLTRHTTSESSNLTVRFGNPSNANSWSDWKTIAFTDSDITGNAATATRVKYIETMTYAGGDSWYGDKYKLYAQWFNGTICDWKSTDDTNNEYQVRVDIAKKLDTPRSLWGNKFDGTQNLDGGIIIKNSSGLYFTNTLGENVLAAYINSANKLIFGFGTNSAGHSTYIHGKNIYFNVGTSATTALTINSNGNVSIGRQDLALSEQRFNVHNLFAIYGDPNSYASSRLNLEEIYRSQGNAVHLYVVKNNDNTNVDLPLVLQNGYGFVGIGTLNPSAKLDVAGTFRASDVATFNGGALIPTGQKLTIGDANGDHATIEYDSIAKAIKVDGNLFTTGTNASGGKADAQQGGTGGNAEVYKYDLGRGEQVYEIQNVKGDVNVNIQVYEWNGNSNSWDMILTDVSVNETNITVTFGRPTSVEHMVTVV